MRPQKVALHVRDPAPEKVNSIVLLKFDKPAQVLLLLVVSHALWNQKPLLIPPLRRSLIKYPIVYELVDLVLVGFPHQWLPIGSQTVCQVFGLSSLLFVIVVKLLLEPNEVGLLDDRVSTLLGVEDHSIEIRKIVLH